jgi:hypothetical protein
MSMERGKGSCLTSVVAVSARRAVVLRADVAVS